MTALYERQHRALAAFDPARVPAWHLDAPPAGPNRPTSGGNPNWHDCDEATLPWQDCSHITRKEN